MFAARKLVLAHFWVAFVAFGAAILLGEWQMLVRSPMVGWVSDRERAAPERLRSRTTARNDR